MQMLRADVLASGKPRIVFQTASLTLDEVLEIEGDIEPIRRTPEERAAEGAYTGFLRYSMEMALHIANQVRQEGREVAFAFIMDDQNTRSEQPAHKRHRLRDRFYRLHSGPDAELFQFHGGYLQDTGFTHADVLRHDHGKPGRRDCVYFSELILRVQGDPAIENACARAYVEFVKRVTDANAHLVSFVPSDCRQAVSDIALNRHLRELSASHVFLNTKPLRHLGHDICDPFYSADASYRHDAPKSPQ